MDDGLNFRAALFQQRGEASDDQAVLFRFQLVDFADDAGIERLAWLDVLDGVLHQLGAFGIQLLNRGFQLFGRGDGRCFGYRWRGGFGSGSFPVAGGDCGLLFDGGVHGISPVNLLNQQDNLIQPSQNRTLIYC